MSYAPVLGASSHAVQALHCWRQGATSPLLDPPYDPPIPGLLPGSNIEVSRPVWCCLHVEDIAVGTHMQRDGLCLDRAEVLNHHA
jgi:hypothetical protein